MTPALRPRLQALIDTLQAGLLERATAVRLLLLAALAGEHVLLIGPPGTAKSALARRLHGAFADTRYFERLLTRFSTPEELFGPLSLKALEDDRYERLIDGYLPTAGVAFLDEVFKANSAILNALLTLLNEREFDNGAGRRRTPLISLVGATNDLPADDSLLAFHDRFLLRVPVAPVSDASFGALLELPEEVDALQAHPALSADDRQALREVRADVTLGAEARAALGALRGMATAASITVSDRRWRQFTALLRMAAASDGRSAVDALDLWLAPYVVGQDAASVAQVAAWFDQRVVQAEDRPLPWLEAAVGAFEQQLATEQKAPAAEADDSAGKLALARAAGAVEPEGGPMRLVAEGLERTLQRRWSPVHVAARVAQVDEVVAACEAAHHTVQQQREHLAAQCAGRLWLPPDLAARWDAAHAATLTRLQALQGRLAACRDGFVGLPQTLNDGQPGEAPPPVALGA